MTGRDMRGRVLGMVATFVLVLGIIPATRSRLDRVLVLTIAVYAGILARQLAGNGARPEPDPPPPVEDLSRADDQNVRVARLDASLARAAESPEQFWRVTRPALRALATERIRLRSGIDVTANPAGARRQMGEELWEMFSTPADHVGPAPGRERLRVLVERLESL